MIKKEISREDLQKELDEIYTPLEEAKVEIWRRWNDKALRKKVEEFLNNDIPESLRSSPRAVLSRQIQSPNFETLQFLELTKDIGLAMTFFEYSCDKFVTKNDDKYYLGRLYFYGGTGKKGGRKLSSFKVMDIDKYDGKPLLDIETFWGEKFVDFHGKLFRSLVSDANICDVAENYRRNGRVADKYYSYYLAMFMCHGILFENYLLSENYRDLTKNIFLPSFKKIWKIFGLKPLIVRLIPDGKENDVFWRYYPQYLENKISDIMNKNK
ncbi:MAG: hypothetical protein C0412_11520 [Flavobacterium sp.]|nr:hypothetical protein [Flavobacterium sp.]